jgi:hypothetical protein
MRAQLPRSQGPPWERLLEAPASIHPTHERLGPQLAASPHTRPPRRKGGNESRAATSEQEGKEQPMRKPGSQEETPGEGAEECRPSPRRGRRSKAHGEAASRTRNRGDRGRNRVSPRMGAAERPEPASTIQHPSPSPNEFRTATNSEEGKESQIGRGFQIVRREEGLHSQGVCRSGVSPWTAAAGLP